MHKNCRAPLGVLLALFPVPAFADHMGPSGVGSGGGISVFGPDTLDGGHWAAGFRLAYTRPQKRSDAELEALASEQIHAHNTDYNLNGSLSAAYGLSHHLTISAELPYIRRDHLREGEHSDVGVPTVNEVVRLGSVSGIGDVNLLAKYRLSEGGPIGFAVIGGIKLPTGTTHRRSPEGERLETEHQPGTGSWDPILGVSASFGAKPVRLAASALYQFSGKGAQQTRLGDRLQGGVALSFRLGEGAAAQAESHNHHHGDELDEQHEARHWSSDAFIELGGESEGRQKVDGEMEDESGGRWIYVAPGVRFNAASGWSAATSIALPVTQHVRASHPENRFRWTLSLGRAF